MKDNQIKVWINEKVEINVQPGTTLKEIARLFDQSNYKNYLGAKINNEIRHLDYSLEENAEVQFLDISHKDGLRIYIRTLSFIFIKACRELFKDCRVSVEHSLSKGLYTEIHKKENLTIDDIKLIKERMKEIVSEGIEIKREVMDIERVKEIFSQQGMDDKLRLLKHTNKEIIHVYSIKAFYDTYYGYLAPSTDYINDFDLQYYKPGVIVQFPRREENFKIPVFHEQNKLAKIYKEAEQWGDILDLGYVGALNDKIEEGSINEVIRISEALHEKKIAYIADKICDSSDIRVILIAGPTSSGKTTFAERLSIQLKANGKKPISISMDDYFVNREDTPLDENGEYDFESIYAVDLELFNQDLLNLLNGEEIELPSFNFVTGKREYLGRKISIDEEHPVIIEGIHGLNEKLTALVPHDSKFKIYISALTQLNIDSHNRIPTTDSRLIRRMVRDSKYRGNDAVRTLELWDSVRRGEERNIFPYQEEADVMFNSALVYELSVLKKYVVPLLEEVQKTSPYYSESKRLLKFISYFKPIENETNIPCTSILREFIGGSCFKE